MQDKQLFRAVGHHWRAVGILFFLIGAMTVVELIDVHGGLRSLPPDYTNQQAEAVMDNFVYHFFPVPALDNLTTTIVMVQLLRKLIKAGRAVLLPAWSLLLPIRRRLVAYRM